MKKKNVLIVSYSYPPANVPAAHRPYTLARDLNRELYNVTVLHCSNGISALGNNGIEESKNEEISEIGVKTWFGKKRASKTNELISEPSIFSLKAKIKLLISRVFALDKGIFWYFPVLNHLKKNRHLIEDSDIVVTTSPLFTNHLLGLYFKKKNPKAHWVADFRDFHYTGLLEYRFLLKLWNKRIEKVVISKADALTFTTAMMQEAYQKAYYTCKSKMHTITNCADVSWYEKLKLEKVLPSQKKKVSFLYAGSYYNGERDVSSFLRLVNAAIEKGILHKDRICIEFAGKMDKRTSSTIEKFESSFEIRRLGVLSKVEVTRKLKQSTVLLLFVASKPSHSGAVPLKFYEFLLARKPILCFSKKSAQVAQWIKKDRLGWVIPIEYEFEKQFEVFMTMLNSNVIKERKDLNTSHLLEEYSCKQQAKHFEAIFDI